MSQILDGLDAILAIDPDFVDEVPEQSVEEVEPEEVPGSGEGEFAEDVKAAARETGREGGGGDFEAAARMIEEAEAYARERGDPFADAGGDDFGSSGGGGGGGGYAPPPPPSAPSDASMPPAAAAAVAAPLPPIGLPSPGIGPPPAVKKDAKGIGLPPPGDTAPPPKRAIEVPPPPPGVGPPPIAPPGVAPKPGGAAGRSRALVPFRSPATAGTRRKSAEATRVRGTGRILPSPIPGISDEAWTDFACEMRIAEPGAVSASNALGMFEMKPRRLEDLGVMRCLSCTRSPTGRMVWVGEFVPPMTQVAFLASPAAQYKAFAASMKRYVDALRDGSIPRPDGGRPTGMSLSGVLAILHRCGPSGLKTWNDEGNRFPQTVSLFERANGIF